jgi:uncharacterized protein
VRKSQQHLADQLNALVEQALARATLPTAYFHGEKHWRRVAGIGLRLLDPMPQADPLVVFLFALFHDSMRVNEGRDPDHGVRGRRLGAELIPNHLDTSETLLSAFTEACDHHTDGELSKDPTVGVCWDSDRLDLWRVGSEPSPRFMSTPLAGKEETILWAESNVAIEPPGWRALADETASATLAPRSEEPLTKPERQRNE